jgi:hypothetical protein
MVTGQLWQILAPLKRVATPQIENRWSESMVLKPGVATHFCVLQIFSSVLPKNLKFVNHIKTVNAAITFKVFYLSKVASS